jgi:hypothetical protein
VECHFVGMEENIFELILLRFYSFELNLCLKILELVQKSDIREGLKVHKGYKMNILL